MAGICCGIVGESEAVSAAVEPRSRSKKRTRLELPPFLFVSSADAAVPDEDSSTRNKRPKIDSSHDKNEDPKRPVVGEPMPELAPNNKEKFGMTSVCGRRRDMEDAVSIPANFTPNRKISFFGVFDGHGCSHVAMRCGDRLHEIVKEEIHKFENEISSAEWKCLMERSFKKMDEEVEEWTGTTAASAFRGEANISSCRCELRTPQRDVVGSTAVVAILTPEKIVVSNCGDSRAVLCRNGVAVPLSTDHKPDRPDELHRIEAMGGRVIYWDGPRVFGVLAMSRAIGDGYLKPFVIPLPEVTVTERTEEDECLIIGSDGLWDVVNNETACRVARMCLMAARKPQSLPGSSTSEAAVATGTGSDKACLDASVLLTKLALARDSTDNVSVVVVDLRSNRRK